MEELKDSPRDSSRDSPRDNQNGKSSHYYQDQIDQLKMAGEIGYYEDRVAKLELIIGRLLKLMPHLEKPD